MTCIELQSTTFRERYFVYSILQMVFTVALFRLGFYEVQIITVSYWSC